jgi:tetratricopeptide (TPR) repeat protein
MAYRSVMRVGEARAAGMEALALSDRLGLLRERAAALSVLSYVERSAGRREEAAQRAQEALAAAEAVGVLYEVAYALEQLGALAKEDNPALAGDYFGRVLEMARREGSRRREATTLGHLAEVSLSLGQVEKAFEHAGASLSLQRQLGNRTGEALALKVLGLAHLAREAGAEEALGCLRPALGLAVQLGQWLYVAGYLEHLGTACERLGKGAVAAACYLTGLQFHEVHRLDVTRWHQHLDRLRQKALAEGQGGWEAAAREHRHELLAEASGLAADHWRTVLAEMLASGSQEG